MKFIFMNVILFVFWFVSLSEAAQSGCDLITSEGKCFSYFTQYSGIEWLDANTSCDVWGGYLASISSESEQAALYTIRNTSHFNCWIGYNDREKAEVYEWPDGSSTSYVNWLSGQPSDKNQKRCTTSDDPSALQWTERSCNRKDLECFYCSSYNVTSFGRKMENSTSVESLANNAILHEDTTLYCITENMNTPHVTWSYADLAGGGSSVLNSTTDVTTGVSSLSVTTDKPGYYSCQVTRNGSNVNYTAVVFDNTNLTVSRSGCDLITSEGKCFKYFTLDPAIDWNEASTRCQIWGGYLASVSSESENFALNSIGGTIGFCWFGLIDKESEGNFVWTDGSNSTYRIWHPSMPDNYINEDCAVVFYRYPFDWHDVSCSTTRGCYYCSFSQVTAFGKMMENSTSVESIANNAILHEDTTLYCITENMNTPHVTWSYADLAGGSSSVLNSTTDVTTGVSSLSVTTDKPGYYSCQVTRNGSNVNYTAVVLQTTSYPENNDLVFHPNIISRAIIIRDGNTTAECKDLTQKNLQISWINVSALPDNHAVSFIGNKLVLLNNRLPPGVYVFECVATDNFVRKSLQLTVRFLEENSTLFAVQNIVEKENATFIETLQAIELLQTFAIIIDYSNIEPNSEIFETLVSASLGLIINLERFSSDVSNDVIDILVGVLSNLIAFDGTRSIGGAALINDGKIGVFLTELILGIEIVGRISLVGLEGNVTERVFISERVVLISQRIPYENGTGELLAIPQSDSIEIFESVSIPGTVVRDLSSEEEFRYSIALITVISNTSNSISGESLGSNLLSLTVSTDPGRKNLTSPILLHFFTPNSKNQEVRCVFLDIQNSIYVSNGLNLSSSDENSTVCESTHLTSFGVLIRAKPQSGGGGGEDRALSSVSYVLLSVSLIALILSILIFIVNGKEFFKVEMNRIYFNYALSLALAIFVFIFGIEVAIIDPNACIAVAFLLHYFWLAVFSWSLCVSIEIIYLLWITSLDRKNLFWYLLPLGWGLPVPIVVISIAVAVRHDTYFERRILHCFLSYSEGLIWSFIGPILVLLFLNLIALIMACIKIVIVTRKGSENHGPVSNWEIAKQSLINSSILFPVLGAPWILLPINLLFNSFTATTAFEWLFCILNGPSGILFFLLYTLKHDLVKEKICRRKAANSSNQKSNPNNKKHRINPLKKDDQPETYVNAGAIGTTSLDALQPTEPPSQKTSSNSL